MSLGMLQTVLLAGLLIGALSTLAVSELSPDGREENWVELLAVPKEIG